MHWLVNFSILIWKLMNLPCPLRFFYLNLIAVSYFFYYINNNEIPGELSRENLISSHVKITCYLHMWTYHRCYGCIINRAFHTKKLLKWNGLVVHWCLYNKKIFHSLAALTREILFNTRREISYLQAAILKCNIFYFVSFAY